VRFLFSGIKIAFFLCLKSLKIDVSQVGLAFDINAVMNPVLRGIGRSKARMTLGT
jgi:hypothetical protein